MKSKDINKIILSYIQKNKQYKKLSKTEKNEVDKKILIIK